MKQIKEFKEIESTNLQRMHQPIQIVDQRSKNASVSHHDMAKRAQIPGTVTPPSPDNRFKVPYMSNSMQLQGIRQHLVFSELPSSSRGQGGDMNKKHARKNAKELYDYVVGSDIESKEFELPEQS
jgi:hypothetical protein